MQQIKNVLYWSKVVVIGVILGTGLQFAQAWVNPTVTPPNGNLDGPINTGIVNQVKSASLGLIGNLSAWMIQPNAVVVENAACPTGAENGLMARDVSGAILSCQSGIWKKAMAGEVTGVTYIEAEKDRSDEGSVSCTKTGTGSNGVTVTVNAEGYFKADGTAMTRVRANASNNVRGCDSGWVSNRKAACNVSDGVYGAALSGTSADATLTHDGILAGASMSVQHQLYLDSGLTTSQANVKCDKKFIGEFTPLLKRIN